MALPKKIGLRGCTGVLYIAVMVSVFFTPLWVKLLFFSLLHFGLWQEYNHLTRQAFKDMFFAPRSYAILCLIIGEAILCWFTPHLFSPNERISLPLIAQSVGVICLFIIPILAFIIYPSKRRTLAVFLLGIVWISLPLGLMMDLTTREANMAIFKNGNIALLAFFGCIWLNDTLAYLIGSMIGRRKLSSISPNKTWEGTIGGIVVTALLAGVVFHTLSWVATPHHIVLPLIIGVFGTLGDLLESKMKRKAQVKDSGKLMPGHGGLLDRLDSALIAIIPVHIYIYLVCCFS